MGRARFAGTHGLAWLLLFWLLAASALAAPDFPALTGRVVDRADMLDPGAQAKLTELLAAHEQRSGEQIVVVTLKSLDGTSIEDYGYQLGRHWGIGQKGEDTGALLIVARAEHKVRIEVGYGLEGRLTDAKSSVIIDQIITPAFRQGHFSGGILRGTAAIISVLGGDPDAAAVDEGTPTEHHDSPSLARTLMFFGLMVAIIVLFGGGGRGGGRRRRRHRFWGVPLPIGGGFGGRSGGFGGGGFSGGGGSFGGGGASGGW